VSIVARKLQHAITDLQNGRFADAARICKSILNTDGRNQDALFILALTELQRQRFRQADQLLGKVLELNPRAAIAAVRASRSRISRPPLLHTIEPSRSSPCSRKSTSTGPSC
jgi:thioredoxin-like negative regulator of GroEL